MSSLMFKIFNRKQQDPPPSKKGIVTGVQDRSEVESMIQRYLELAESALKEEAEAAPGTEEEISA